MPKKTSQEISCFLNNHVKISYWAKIVKLKRLYIYVEKYICFTNKINFISVYLYKNSKFKTTFWYVLSL